MGQILLVRHGQASWGADDYDVLSEVGWEQSRVLGRALAARGVVPSAMVRGSMRRHRETAEGMAEGMVQGLAAPAFVVDEGWDEFDSVDVFATAPRAPSPETEPKEFHAWFESAMERWTGGEHEADYAEPFAAFTERVSSVLERTAELARSGTVVVVTSGGAISWCVATLLGERLDRAAQVALSRTVNPICANSGVTKIVVGRRGTTMVTYNEHTHLEQGPGLLTYR